MTDIKTIQLSNNTPSQVGNSARASQDGDMATIFQDEDGFYGYCLHGVAQGLGYESEDVSGFDTVEEAEAAARDQYQESK